MAASRALGRAAISASGDTQLFDLATGVRAGKTTEGCSRVLHHGLGFGGGNLVIACEDKLEVLDATALTKVKSVRIEPSKVQAASVSWPRVALAHEDGVIRIYSLDGAAERQIAVPGPPIEVTSLALSRDGERVAVGWTHLAADDATREPPGRWAHEELGTPHPMHELPHVTRYRGLPGWRPRQFGRAVPTPERCVSTQLACGSADEQA